MENFNNNIIDWDKFLIDVDKEVKIKGYKKFNQNYKNEDFSYWKTVKDEKGNGLYQVGLLIYDFRKYVGGHHISIAYCCVLFSEGSIELNMSGEISVDKFEQMASWFHQGMSNHITKE